MKNFLIFISVTIVFGLAANDFLNRLNELDKISKSRLKTQIVKNLHNNNQKLIHKSD